LQKVAGWADVDFVVGVDGRVTDLRVTDASHPKFGAYLVDAVKHWVYEPSRCGGVARAASMRQRFDFTIGP
jgi:TonB family protein